MTAMSVAPATPPAIATAKGGDNPFLVPFDAAEGVEKLAAA